MLSQASHSSKRLDKLKKYKNKLGGSGFQFLLQSLDRDKQNHMPNAHPINYGQLSQSVNVDSQVPLPFSHIGKKQQKNKDQHLYIENVKILDCSDLSISEASDSRKAKKPTKKYYNHDIQKERESLGSKSVLKQSFMMSKQLERSYNTIGQKNGGVTIEKQQFDELMKKMKQYMTLTNEVMNGPEPSCKFKSKIKGFHRDIIKLLDSVQNNDIQSLSTLKPRDSLDRSRPTMMKSEILGCFQSEEYIRAISHLESQRDKLKGLVSEHQLANIKLFVKMNDGESDQIEKCKRQLVLLFTKYKQLEKIIKSDKKKMEELVKENQSVIQKYRLIRGQNKQMMQAMKELSKNKEKDHRRNTSDFAFQELVSHNERSLLRPREGHSRQGSGQSYQQNSINELHLDSLINSRFSDENGLGSSIRTTNSKMGFNQRGKIGINLNALVESIKQENFKKLMQEPQRLKKIIEECRKSMINMENVISEQNKEFQVSIKAIQEGQEQGQNQQQRIKQLQNKLITLQLDLKRQKSLKIELENVGNKQKQKSKVIKLSKNVKKNIQTDSRSNKQEKTKYSDSKDGAYLDNFPTIKYADEYRIIHSQAQALEKLMENKKWK